MTISRELLAVALCATLVACTAGDDATDTGSSDTGTTTDTGDTGPTDTGDTDTGGDTGDTGPTCGDGVVDADEACDEGEDNGPDGSCSEDCEWNNWQSCSDVTGPAYTLDTATAQPDGRYHLSERFSGLSGLTTSCLGDVAHNAVVTFTLPTSGTWVLSTDNAQTLVPTAISLRTDCDDRAEISCSTGGTAGPNGAQAVIVDGEAGTTYVAVIENLGTTAGTWHLSLGEVTEVAGEGDSCDDAHPCEEGTVCTDGTCLPLEAPAITSSSLVQIDTYQYLLTLAGTDANRDVTTGTVAGFTDIYSDVWGDEAGEDPIALEGEVQWVDSAFTYTAIVGPIFFDTGLSDAVTVDVLVSDASGLSSDAVTLTFDTPVSNEIQEYIGDTCDMCVDCSGNTNGFPRYCNPNPHADPNDSSVTIPGLACTWDDTTGTTASCQDRNVNEPPRVDSLTMYWAGEESLLLAQGFDFRHDQGQTAHITVVDDSGERTDIGSAYLPGERWDGGHFTARGVFDASEVSDIDFLEILIEDRGFPSATTETPIVVDWVDYTAPVEVGAGEECDLMGWDSVCEAPDICSPTLSGVPGCMPSEAPELLWATGTYAGGFFPSMVIEFEGYDTNADWGAVMSEAVRGQPLPAGAYDYQGWAPSPFAQQSFTGTVFAPFPDWLIRVSLQDADGNTSESTVISGVDTLATGEDCNTGVCNFFGCQPPVSFCDVEMGDTCAIGADTPVCEANEAPVLASVVARRTGANSYSIEFDGTDRNGDALKAVVFRDEDGVTEREHVNFDMDLPIEGATSFISEFEGDITDPTASVTVSLSLQDWGFAESNVIDVAIPPIVEAGGTCSGDDTVDACVEGAECLDGVCFAYEPQLTDATIAWSANGRDATVTVTGLDDHTGANQQLRNLSVTVGGTTVEASMSQYNTDWNGNAFSFDIDVKGLGTGALVDERFLSATVTDLGGFSDTGTFFITPHVGFGGTCDVDELADTCHAGLACDGTAVCDNDPTDACAGVPVTDVVGESADWLFASSGNGLDTYSAYDTCGGSNNPNGLEQAFAYTASQTGTLTITSSSTDGDAHPGYLFVRAAECVNEAALIGCSNNIPNGSTVGDNSVTVDVVAGELLYVTVDGPSWKKGGGTLTFTY